MYNSFDTTPDLSHVPESLQNRELEMSPRQAEIYRNLEAIGPEIAAFYRSGIKVLRDNDLEASAYLLAHLAREIGGGLTDVLKVKRSDTLEVVVQTPDGGKLTDEQEMGKPLEFDINVPGTVQLSYKKKQGGHKDSILQFLGTDENSPLAKRWIEVAKNFAKYAHRHGVWKPPRTRDDFVPLWHEFENVLADLVGNHFNFLSRLDRFLKLKEPNEQIRKTLPNLLALDIRRAYFFSKLDSPAWLKPLKEDGWFNPERNPAPQEVVGSPGNYYMPIWYALNYVARVAKHPDRPVGILVKIVDAIVNDADASGESIGNRSTAWQLIKIIRPLPVGIIDARHIAFICTTLKTRGVRVGLSLTKEVRETLLPKLLDAGEKELILALLKGVLDESVDAYSLKDALRNREQTIARLCGVEASRIGLTQIQRLVTEDASVFDLIQLGEGDASKHAYENYPKFVVRFTCSMLQFATPESITETVAALLQESRRESRAIFGLIALNAIKHHYAELKRLFWKWQGNPLEEVWLKPELYDLIQTRCTAFSDAEIEQILHWIESSQDAVLPEDAEKRAEVLAYRKREWLSALVRTGNEKVLAAIEKYERINPAKLERPGLNFSITPVSWEGETSPITVEVLAGMSNAEIAAYLRNFKETSLIGPSVPTALGLGDTLAECVATDPERFTENLLPFQCVPPLYQTSMLQAFSKAWREKKDVNWEALLDFIYQLISSEAFWTEQQKPHLMFRSWIYATEDLITAGTEDDNHAFDVSLLPLAEQIIFVLVEKVNPSVTALGNLPTAVLNSDRGKVFSAMINYALRFARTSNTDKKDGIRWPHAVREEFTKRLDRRVEYSLEFSFTLGAYLPNLFYLDKAWVIANVDRIFPQEDDVHRHAAFSGYLFYSKIYSELHSLLKEHGHYQWALEMDFGNEIDARRLRERLVTHICVGWTAGVAETLEDETSLIYQLINRGSPELLSALIHFFWRQRDALPTELKEKVRPTWRALCESLSRKENVAEYQEVLAQLSIWANLVDRIDTEVLNSLKLSARFLKDHDTTFLVKALRHHAVETPEEVGTVYLDMLTNHVYPDYDWTDIEETVRILYRAGHKQVADRICNLYGEVEVDLLRALYDEYQH